MTQVPVGFTLDTLTRKKIEKWRRKKKDAFLHNRFSVLLWLIQFRSANEFGELRRATFNPDSRQTRYDTSKFPNQNFRKNLLAFS